MAITKGVGVAANIGGAAGEEVDWEAVGRGLATTQNEPENLGDRPPYKPSIGQSFDWQTKFRTDVVSAIEKWADTLGYDKQALDPFVRDNIDGAIRYIVDNKYAPDPRDRISTGKSRAPMSLGEYQKLWNAGLTYFSMLVGYPLMDEAPTGTGRRGSSGPSGPTAQDIRNQFDLDELTEAATNMWRSYLVEEPTEARNIAKSYVDAVVSTMGEEKLDFNTFVLNKIKGSTRYDLVYQNKPEGVSELQYIQPFLQSAAAVMGSNNQEALSDVVGGGAALGASSADFRGRLQRTRGNQQSTGFITNLENQMRNVKGVLQG